MTDTPASRRLLHISASPRGAASESLAIADSFLTVFADANPDVAIETFDLWDGTLPAFGPDAAAAKMSVFAGPSRRVGRPRRGRRPATPSVASIRPTGTCSACRCGTTAFPTSSSS